LGNRLLFDNVEVPQMLRFSLLTLLVLTPACFANAQVPVTTSTSSPTSSAPAPDLSKIDIPTVPFCDLVSHADKYDNQIVRTQAIIYYGFEASVLYHVGCDRFDTWAAYDSSYDGKTQQGKRLFKMLTKGNSGDYNSAQVTVVGRFLGKKQVAFRVKDKTYYTGYGHMNMFDSQLTIMRLDDVTPTPREARR